MKTTKYKRLEKQIEQSEQRKTHSGINISIEISPKGQVQSGFLPIFLVATNEAGR